MWQENESGKERSSRSVAPLQCATSAGQVTG